MSDSKKGDTKMKNVWNRIIAMVVVIGMLISQGSAAAVYAAEMKDYVPITAYTLKGQVTTYVSVSGSVSGYISAGDKCTILKMYDVGEGWLYVEYPKDSGGTKKAYVKAKEFFLDYTGSKSLSSVKIGKNLTVYRKSDMKQTIGEVYASDDVIIVGNNGTNTQIIYPVSGGYKLGFIQGVYDKESGLKKVELEEGYYQIKSATNQNYVVDVYGGYTDDGANIQLYQNQYTANQGYLILKFKSGYVIMAYHSGKVFDIYNNEKAPKTSIIQWTFHGGDNQIFEAYETLDGKICFKSVSSNLFVDVCGNYMQNETDIIIYPYNGTTGQQFVLERVTIGGKHYDGSVKLGGSDSATQNSNATSSTEQNTSAKINEIVTYVLSQVGVRDNKGDNHVKYNTWYYGKETYGSGFAWCQAFISYAAKECGVLNTAIPKENSCARAIEWYKNEGQFHLAEYYGGNYKPQPGDLVFYGKNGAEHVGMIVGESVDGYLQVVEGNVENGTTGHYEVVKFTRNYKRQESHPYVYGYAHPTY